MTAAETTREHGRDRRKRLTRQALRRAALELGLEHGFSSVSVEAVAERAGVSTRTFFNYFASKEDAALLDLFQIDDAAVTTLGQGESATAWHDLCELFAADLERAVEDPALLQFFALQEQNPGLAGRQLATFARLEARVSAAVQQRLDGWPDASARAAMMVGCCLTAVRIAVDGWARGDRQHAVRPHLERVLAVVAPAFGSP